VHVLHTLTSFLKKTDLVLAEGKTTLKGILSQLDLELGVALLERQRRNAEHTEITEHAEKAPDFRVFRYFRMFRVLPAFH
jgi:hypothetical protein